MQTSSPLAFSQTVGCARRQPWRRALLATLALGLSTCADAKDECITSRVSSALVGGVAGASYLMADADELSGVVSLEISFESTPEAQLCSGILITGHDILTARHCIAELSNPTAPCAAELACVLLATAELLVSRARVMLKAQPAAR